MTEQKHFPCTGPPVYKCSRKSEAMSAPNQFTQAIKPIRIAVVLLLAMNILSLIFSLVNFSLIISLAPTGSTSASYGTFGLVCTVLILIAFIVLAYFAWRYLRNADDAAVRLQALTDRFSPSPVAVPA